MTQTQQHCSTLDHLLAFLRGQLSSHEETELQLHLNDCLLCREQLENAAADASTWSEAQQFFKNEVSHRSSADLTNGHAEETQGSQRIRHVLDTLGPTDDPESLGRIGGYEVTGVVGSGGMGVVFKAHDRSLDRIVAIKVMSPHLACSGSARRRFAREAKAAAAVLHPNVIAIHSVASEDAIPYLVMPYVRGASLQKRIDSQGPLPLRDTLRIGAQIASGLAAAHDQGLVHRDIKPANILLEEGVERVTITDFGLARAVDDASMTCSGVIAGTPQYMSPEQTRGEPIDARSDLFSLGSVLYAMCVGRSPFRAETTYGVLHRIANDNPTPVCEVNSDVPAWLGHIIKRLMAKQPDDRFESATQVHELLERCLAHVQQPAAMPLPEAVAALAPREARRLPIKKLIAASAGAFALVFAGVLIVLELNKGTLTIESALEDIPIRIMQGGKIVDRLTVTKSPHTVRIAAGDYVVEIDGDFQGVTINDGRVSLARRGAATVNIEPAEDLNASITHSVPDSNNQSLQGVWEFISVESDGVVREYETHKPQPSMARLTITGDMWMVKAGDGSGGSDLGSGGHRVRIDGSKLTFYGTTTSKPGFGSSKEIPTISYGLFKIVGDSLVYLVTPAAAGGELNGQIEPLIKFPESFETKGTHNNVFRLRRAGVSASASHDPDLANRVPSSRSSPQYPQVKIVVHDEEGKPLEGVQVNLFHAATKEGRQILEVSETSDASGLAVNRNLPFGHYELSAKTKDGWYLSGSKSHINVEFEKGLDLILVAPTPVPFGKLTIRDDATSQSAASTELRFGILEEVNGPGFWVSSAPEPESDLGDYETFPTLSNGIEYVGVEIRFEMAKNISQPSRSATRLNTKWQWTPVDEAKSTRRYLIVNGQARAFVAGSVYEGRALDARPVEGSELFKLPSATHRVGASLIALREPMAMPLEIEIPAGEISIYVERFLGKPNAAAMKALNWQPHDDQPELWLEANVQRNSAWIERLIDTTRWIPTTLKPGYNDIAGHLQMRKLIRGGETLEVSLGTQKVNTKDLNPLEARTLDDVTSLYNEQTRQLRTELFNPPIPDLTTDQMRAAMLDPVERYRKHGKVEIASALKTSAETNHLTDRLTFMGMSGTMSDGFRQITPMFAFEVASNARVSIVLNKAELRYRLNGWSSKTWGDIHPPIIGKWELTAVEESGETLTQEAFKDWQQRHANWKELNIDEKSLTMSGDTATKFDFEIDHYAGMFPQYTIRRDGETKFEGVLLGNGLVDETTLVFAVDLSGDSKPTTFQTKDGKTTNLTYRRVAMDEVHVKVEHDDPATKAINYRKRLQIREAFEVDANLDLPEQAIPSGVVEFGGTRLRIDRAQPPMVTEDDIVAVELVTDSNNANASQIQLPPSLLCGLDANQLAAILSHEMAHLRRYDLLVNLLQRVVEALLFFHPVTCWISRRIRIERENCCDDLAAAGCGRFEYASALLRIAGQSANIRGLKIAPQLESVTADGGNTSQLGNRIKRMLGEDDTPRISLTRGAIVAITLTAVLGGLSMIAVAQTGGDETSIVQHHEDEVSSDSGSFEKSVLEPVTKAESAPEDESSNHTAKIIDESTIDPATKLGRGTHQQMAAIDKLPKFYWASNNATLGTFILKNPSDDSLENLLRSLDAPDGGAKWFQYHAQFGWDENHFIQAKGGDPPEEVAQFRWGTRDLAVERNGRGDTVSYVLQRDAATMWKDNYLTFPNYILATRHVFWWGDNGDHRKILAGTGVPPSIADYEQLSDREFDGELCHVFRSRARREMLVISKASGLLRGYVLIDARKYAEDVYKLDSVKKITGVEFRTQREYWSWCRENELTMTSRQRWELSKARSLAADWSSSESSLLVRFRDYREIVPGVMWPFREDRVQGSLRNGKFECMRSYDEVQTVVVDKDLTDKVNEMRPKDGEHVQDQRFQAIVDYRYSKDRSNAEIMKLVDEAFQRQMKDQLIVDEAKKPYESMIGTPAPKLPEKNWVGGQRPELDGKPYLVHFWATWCGPCKNDLPLLKRFSDAGGIVIGMHPGGTPVDEVTAEIKSVELSYPTYVSPEQSSSDNPTIATYPATMYPYCLLVDGKGIVVAHGSLGDEKFDVFPRYWELVQSDKTNPPTTPGDIQNDQNEQSSLQGSQPAQVPAVDASSWIPARPLKVIVSKGSSAKILDDDSVRLEGDVRGQEASLQFEFDKPTNVEEIRLELLSVDSQAGPQFGRGGKELLLFEVIPGIEDQAGKFTSLDFASCTYLQNPSDDTTIHCIDYLSDTGWTVPNLPESATAHELVLRFKKPITLRADQRLTLTVDSGGSAELGVLNRIRFAFHHEVVSKTAETALMKLLSAGERVEIEVAGAEFAYRWCPAGEFKMGASEDARKEYGDRFEPQHDVRISTGFWMQETEVTQMQYEKVMRQRPAFWNVSLQSDDISQHPVEQVSWFDAKEFCERLSTMDAANDYRLPTEAEWEYACRAGTTKPRYGDLKDIAWTFQTTDEAAEGSTGHRHVGLKKPNSWGLYDMLGNVGEWCSDWHGPPQLQFTTDPTGPETGESRVVRGDDCFGDCTESFPGCLAGARASWQPNDRSRIIGFRVVRIPIVSSSADAENASNTEE